MIFPLSQDDKKATTVAWFTELRDRIHRRLEVLEREAPDALYPGKPSAFVLKPWQRKVENGGGGVGGMLHGRLFEKAGVHVSEVRGEFTPDMAARVPGAADDPRFWAAGISLIVHPRNPHIPAVHMNTRYIVTTQDWFGGGADLTPLLAHQRDPNHRYTKDFHTGMKAACDAHSAADYPRFREWCDNYFHLAHRDEPRGIGGIFYDRYNSGDWNADFAFTRDVGTHFLDTYEAIVRDSWATEWSEAERNAQLIQRGRYVEFNLLYDRGTMFGLKTGGNVETILSSMPPVVKWP